MSRLSRLERKRERLVAALIRVEHDIRFEHRNDPVAVDMTVDADVVRLPLRWVTDPTDPTRIHATVSAPSGFVTDIRSVFADDDR